MKTVVKLLLLAVFVVSALAVPVAKPILGFGGGFSGSNGEFFLSLSSKWRWRWNKENQRIECSLMLKLVAKLNFVMKDVKKYWIREWNREEIYKNFQYTLKIHKKCEKSKFQKINFKKIWWLANFKKHQFSCQNLF